MFAGSSLRLRSRAFFSSDGLFRGDNMPIKENDTKMASATALKVDSSPMAYPSHNRRLVAGFILGNLIFTSKTLQTETKTDTVVPSAVGEASLNLS